MARPGIEPRASDLRVRCPTDCATRPGLPSMEKGEGDTGVNGTGRKIIKNSKNVASHDGVLKDTHFKLLVKLIQDFVFNKK